MAASTLCLVPMILIPSFKSRISRLNGLKTGVSSGDRRNPACMLPQERAEKGRPVGH